MVVAASVAALAGCGGNGTATEADRLESPDAAFIAEADAICLEGDAQLARYGGFGLSLPGLAQELQGTAQAGADRLAALEELMPPSALTEDYDGWLELVGDAEDAYAEAAKAAARGDQKATDAALANALGDEIKSTAREDLGLEQCLTPDSPAADSPDLEPELSGVEAPTGIDFKPASNTVAEAAESYLAAVTKGDCDEIDDQIHSDNGELDPAGCELEQSNQGLDIVATEQWGPAGVAVFYNAETGARFAMAFGQDDDGVIRRLTSSVAGYYPLAGRAPEGNDADSKLTAALDAIRSDDVEAFNATLPPDSLPPEDGGFEQTGVTIDSLGPDGEVFVDAIKGAPDAEPVPLGINAAYAIYLIDTGGRSWILALTREPGTLDEYGFSGFWPIAPVEG